MSLLTSSIDLDMIVSPASESILQFQSSQIDSLANLFLQAGGTIKPILLRRVSPISFEVLEGHFEYYAAMKAQQIDDQFTAIRAYVVPPELEATILAQYQFLRSHSLLTATEPQPAREKVATQQIDLAQLERSIANHLEQKLSTSIDRVVEERVNASLQGFTNQITQQLNAGLLDLKQLLSLAPINQAIEPPSQLETIPAKTSKTKATKATKTTAKAKESVSEPQAKDQTIESFNQQAIEPPSQLETIPAKTPKTTRATRTPAKAKEAASEPKTKNKPASSINHDDSQSLQVLHDFNTLNVSDLERKLSQLKPSQRKLAQSIHKQRLLQPDQKFESIDDIMQNISGIKEATMKKIITGW